MPAAALVGTVFLIVVSGCLSPDWRQSSPAEPRCFAGGDWEQTPDAEWLREALATANLRIESCTGSAFVVRLRRTATRVGADVYIWAFGPTKGSDPLTSEAKRRHEVAGAQVYVNELRAAWIAQGRYVWVQAGPMALELPPLDMLSQVVAATVR